MGNYGLAVDAGPVEDEPASSGAVRRKRGWLRSQPRISARRMNVKATRTGSVASALPFWTVTYQCKPARSAGGAVARTVSAIRNACHRGRCGCLTRQVYQKSRSAAPAHYRATKSGELKSGIVCLLP